MKKLRQLPDVLWNYMMLISKFFDIRIGYISNLGVTSMISDTYSSFNKDY